MVRSRSGGLAGLSAFGWSVLGMALVGCMSGDPIESSTSGEGGASGPTTNGPGTTTTDSTSSSDGGASTISAGGSGEGGQGECLAPTAPCGDTAECCDGFECAMTSLGQVCCGQAQAPCATDNGEDCCGDLLCVAGTCLPAGAMPIFQAPFPCDEVWTYSHHDGEVRRALDFIDTNGGTDNSPVLAAAKGFATQHFEAGGAGNYISIEHGGGWRTYYFHLQAFSVPDGTAVEQGQEVGRVGSTGASSGPHLHFEQLLNGEGKDIRLDGVGLGYPGEYFVEDVTSKNACEGG